VPEGKEIEDFLHCKFDRAKEMMINAET